MNVRMREVGFQLAERGLATEAELAVLADDLYAGQLLTADAVHVRRMLLCHDQYDRTYERFPRQMLQRFAETLPGKSMLPCHDTGGWTSGSLPLARFFEAGLVRRTEDSFPVVRRARPRRRDAGDSFGVDRAAGSARQPQQGPDAAPPGFDLERVAVTYLQAKYYFPAHDSTDALRVHIDSGVYKWVSVGFSYDDILCDVCGNSYLNYSACPHLLGRHDEETGTLVTATYGGNMEFCEAREGSLVYLGGQQRARNIKSMVDAGRVDVDALCRLPGGEEDLVLRKDAEDLARRYGSQKRLFTVGDLQLTAGDAGNPDDCPAPVGLALSDEAQMVLAVGGRFVNRAQLAAQQRSAKGKPMGLTTLAGLRDLRAQLDDVLAMAELHDDVPAEVPSDRRAEVDALLRQAKAQSIVLGLETAP